MERIQLPFLNAYTFGFCEKREFTKGSGWKWSLGELKRTTGCNAIILPVCAWQDHTYSTVIDSEHFDVMGAEDVKRVCDEARSLGLKVILKAMVNCRDGYWRAYIRFFDHDVPTEPGWAEWFASWESHVSNVARMAEENKADLFCIGCETVGTDEREAEWREVIKHVRALYHGPITYNCDKYQEGNVSWWDAVDVISSSGYYPINQLSENFARIHEVSERFRKPFMFMECGCPSRGKSDLRPNDWRFGEGLDLETQERWYRAFVDEIKKNPWIRGTGWWDWSASRLYPEEMGKDNVGYCTYGKPANDVLLQFSKEGGRTMNKIIKSLFDRKSVRAYTDQEIAEEDVQMILTAATQAPSAGNQQLYTILRVTDPEKKHQLSISCDNQPFIEKAKLVLIFCADCHKWYQAFKTAGCDPRPPEAGDLMLAVTDAAIAAQNAVVAADSLGIGSCYIGDIMENVETQREILDLPKYVFPAAMLVFGYPTEQQKERKKPERVSMKYIVQENTYHEHTADELRNMLAKENENQSWEQWMQAFCNRKYNSEFAVEMSRSVKEYLKDFEV